jgi:hypothetical protein
MDKLAFEKVQLNDALRIKLFRALVEHTQLDDLIHLERDVLWRKEVWLVDYEHHKQERARQSKQARLWNLKKEACAIIVKYMRELTVFVDVDDMELIAMQLIEKQDEGKLAKFGLIGEEWKELFEDYNKTTT